MKVVASDAYQIVSDGTTVWVNDASGGCVARFGVMGVDIHRAPKEQASGGVECLLCTHERTGLDAWGLFQREVLRFHGVDVPDKHCPQRLRPRRSATAPRAPAEPCTIAHDGCRGWTKATCVACGDSVCPSSGCSIRLGSEHPNPRVRRVPGRWCYDCAHEENLVRECRRMDGREEKA